MKFYLVPVYITCLLLLIRFYRQWKRGLLSLSFSILFSAFILSASITLTFPPILDSLANFLGLDLGVQLAFFISIVTLFLVCKSILVRIRTNERKTASLARSITTINFKKEYLYPRLHKTAQRIFSKTLSLGNILVIWKLLESPKRLISKGCLPSIRCEPSQISPLVGAKRPLIKLNKVDFPAPLGPMMAKRSPAVTAKSMPRMIWVLPKLL